METATSWLLVGFVSAVSQQELLYFFLIILYCVCVYIYTYIYIYMVVWYIQYVFIRSSIGGHVTAFFSLSHHEGLELGRR